MRYETNIFKIENLNELTANYVLFEIIGLYDNDEDYDNNIQYIIKSLSYALKHPVTALTKGVKPFLVIRDEHDIVSEMPTEYVVKRDEIVYFKKIAEPFKLDFVNYNEETKGVILRFLQFDIQTELNKNNGLWQPGSGDAFFNKTPFESNGNVAAYNGFFIRAVELPERGFGFALDITTKYVSRYPLDVHLTRNEFKNKGISKSHLVYQYGNKRYEIKVEQFSDLNASQYKFACGNNGELVTLLQDTQNKFANAMPPEVANLPDDAAVLIYRTNDNQERRVIAGLCYKVYDTEDPLVRKLHHLSIIYPFLRRKLIRAAYHNYLKKVMYGSLKLKINAIPIKVEKSKFLPPDILFGNNVSLSVRNTPGVIRTIVEQLGRKRKDLLTDENVGFYTKAEFETQYFVVPQTIFNMYGNEAYFLDHLISEVNRMHRTEAGWKPEIITYDNRNKRNVVEIGFEIIQKIKETVGRRSGGYALVMLPSSVERIKRQHDDLAALVVSECLEEHKITTSIMHSDTLEECYLHKSIEGKSSYFIKHDLKGKYSGYVKGVAINQVLLNNERWPYVLNTPLHADLTIGIDVKKQIAGFTFIDKYSKNILTKFDKSTNKERLSTSQIMRMLVKYITLQSTNANYPFKQIVIHRDGRLFRSEKEGIQKAIASLEEKGVLLKGTSINIVEIPKHSLVPFRVFDIVREYDVYRQEQDNGYTLNPEIGSWVKMNEKEAFLCTTGREFNHKGSSIPLYIKYESGSLKIEDVLEDIFFLSCLAYTKPDDCSRYPLTIKITDRRINTLGSNFDLESLDILKSEHFNM